MNHKKEPFKGSGGCLLLLLRDLPACITGLPGPRRLFQGNLCGEPLYILGASKRSMGV